MDKQKPANKESRNKNFDKSAKPEVLKVNNLEHVRVSDAADDAYAYYFADERDFLQQMAASVAHEVRNPIQAAMGLMQIMNRKYFSDQYFVETSQCVIEQLDFANNILTSFLNISTPNYGKIIARYPADIVHDAYCMMRGMALLSGITLVEECYYNEPVQCYDTAVKQILINLIRNALEAGTKDGVVTLSVYREDDSVIIGVKDSGEGMGSDDLENVFKAFVTSKEKGNGLGLTICYRICRSIGAQLRIETAKGMGAIFSLVIPIINAI